MPTVGPSILFAAGLALGVGTGVLIPRLGKADAPPPPVFTPPPPPSGEKREVGKLATPTGGVMLAGAFPGACEQSPLSSHVEAARSCMQVRRPT
jgi:endonuclease G